MSFDIVIKKSIIETTINVLPEFHRILKPGFGGDDFEDLGFGGKFKENGLLLSYYWLSKAFFVMDEILLHMKVLENFKSAQCREHFLGLIQALLWKKDDEF